MGRIIRGLSVDGSVRIFVIDSTDIVNAAIGYHHTAPTATAALGRVLTGASLMGCMLKNEGDSLTLQFRGSGPAGSVLAVADDCGNVKGTISNPAADLPLKSNGKLDVAGLIGKGSMYVIRDEGEKEPYIGISEITSGEIAEDLTAYFAHSEQTPTLCALGVLVDTDCTCKAAGGVIVQALPGADGQILEQIEKNAAKLGSVSSLVAAGKSCEEIADMALEGVLYDLYDEIEANYICDCSKDRMGRGIATLNDEDVEEIFRDSETAEAVCRFCGKKYTFTRAEIEGLRNKAKTN